MKTCPTEEELAQDLDGELTSNRSLQLRDHVATCSSCQALVNALRDVMDRLAVPPVQPAGDAAAFVAQVIARRNQAPRRRSV